MVLLKSCIFFLTLIKKHIQTEIFNNHLIFPSRCPPYPHLYFNIIIQMQLNVLSYMYNNYYIFIFGDHHKGLTAYQEHIFITNSNLSYL